MQVRDCLDYEIEYKKCRSLRGKFHQYFIFGELLDCTHYKKKWKNCNKCMENDFKACADLIRDENELREKRIKNHLANDVWEKREKPPSDWNKELPEWLKERQKYSYLDDEESRCIIF